MNDAQISLPRIIAPPPVLYIGAFGIGCAIDAISPQPIIFSGSIVWVIGALLFVISGALARLHSSRCDKLVPLRTLANNRRHFLSLGLLRYHAIQFMWQ